jgi:uncharacterized membrane protein
MLVPQRRLLVRLLVAAPFLVLASRSLGSTATILPCHQHRVLALLDPYRGERDIVPGWRCSGIAISDVIDIAVRRGDERIDITLHDPGWSGQAAHRSTNFLIAVSAAPRVDAAEVARVGAAVAAVIAANDRESFWYYTAYSPIPVERGPTCVSPRVVIVVMTLLTVVFAIGLHWLLFVRPHDRGRGEAVPRLSAPEWAALLALMTIAALAYLIPSYLRFTRYGIHSADLGIYTHAFWNAWQGNGLFNSPEGLDHLSSHASPGLYLLLPLYALVPHPFTLLVLNGLALVSGAIPAYLLARRLLGAASSLCCAMIYLCNPALASLNYDVHEITFALPLLLWALLFLQHRRSGLMLLTLILALSWKENVGLTVCFIGTYALIAQRKTHLGSALILLGLVWVVAGINLIIPFFGGSHGNDTMMRYAALGSDWIDLLLAPLRRPRAFWGTVFSRSTAVYLYDVLRPFGFLPVLAPQNLWLAVPPLAENILDGDGVMRSGQYHYEALLLPVLYFAFVGGVARLSAWARAATSATTAARLQGAFLVLLVLSQPLHRTAGRALLSEIDGDAARTEIDRIVAQVPPRVSVISPQNIQPHLSDRMVSAYFHTVADLVGDYPPFTFAVLPTAVQPPAGMYDVVWQGASYSLFKMREGGSVSSAPSG